MRNTIVFIIILLIACSNINSQEIDQNIVSSLEETQKKFTARRNLTYEYLTNNNFEKIHEFFENPLVLRLPTGYEENFQSFYKEEITILLFWLGDYQAILNVLVQNQIPKGAIIESGKEQQSIIPYKNSFYTDILELSAKNQEKLKEKIKAGDLTAQEKEFLLLYLDFRLAETQLEEFDKESLISQAKKYTTKYPTSEFNNYIQSNIDVNYKTSNFGIGSTLFIGGYSFSDNLGKNISGGMPIGGIINLAYSNLILDFHFTGSLLSKVKQDFTYEEIWKKGSKTTLAFGSFNLGYALINNQKMMLTPSIGLAATNISSYIRSEERDEEQGIANIKIDNMPVLHASLTYDYRIWHKTHINSYNDRLIAEFDKTYWIIRLKAGFINPNFKDENKVFKGNIFYLGAGIGIFTYPAVSIKQK